MEGDAPVSIGAINVDSIRSSLQTRRVGRQVEYVDSTTSTNDDAWRYLDRPGGDGLVIFAEHQSAGRGRLGRTWLAPRGSALLMSLLLIDEAREFTPGEISLIPPVAVADAVQAATGLATAIKWPNDLLLSGRKLGGILVESRDRRDAPRAYVVGIGINCLQQPGHFPPELQGRATSLEIQSPHPVDRTALAIELLHQLDRWFGFHESWTEADLRHAWLQRAAGFGDHVRVRCEGREFDGTIVDVDPTAALVVRLDNGVLRSFPAHGTSLVDAPALRGTIPESRTLRRDTGG